MENKINHFLENHNIYRQELLKQAQEPYHFQSFLSKKNNLQTTAAFNTNSYCGDNIQMTLEISHNYQIRNLYFSGECCMVTMACASILCRELEILTLNQANKLLTAFIKMLDNGQKDYLLLQNLVLFANIKHYPYRRDCILVVVKPLQKLIQKNLNASIQQQKKTLRSAQIKILANISIPDKQKADAAITTKILNLITYKQIKHIAIYWSKDTEVSTHNLINKCLASGINVYLPRILDDKSLIFHKVNNSDSDLKFNENFNLQEPKTILPVGDLDKIECQLVPLLAFDQERYRLGRGFGYYDRVLAKFNGLKIGIGYRQQKVLTIPRNEYDVQLDEIITN